MVKILKLRNTFHNVAGYKINKQKSADFLQTKDQHKKPKLGDQYFHPKTVWELIVNKNVNDLDSSNCKIMKKETKEDTRRR